MSIPKIREVSRFTHPRCEQCTNRWNLASTVGRTQSVTVAAHGSVHRGGSRMEATPTLTIVIVVIVVVIIEHEGIGKALVGVEPSAPEGIVVSVEAIFPIESRQILTAGLYLTLTASAWGLEA